MFNEMPELENLDAAEVSFVPEGANRKKFIIRKEGELEMEEKDTEIINEILNTEFEDEERFNEIAKEAKLSEKASRAMKGATRILQAFKDELPKEFLSKLSELAGLTKAGHEDNKEEKKKMKKEEIKNEDKKAEKVDTKISKEDLEKVSPEIKEKLEAVFKSNEELLKANEGKVKEIEKLSEVVKEEKNARILKEFKEEVQNEYSSIATSDDLGPVLKEMQESLDKESYEKITNILKQAEVITKTSEVLREYGTSHSEGERTLRVKIEKGKSEIRKSDSSMTDAQAEDKFFQDNPGVYDEYITEQEAK